MCSIHLHPNYGTTESRWLEIPSNRLRCAVHLKHDNAAARLGIDASQGLSR
jgi:hypothetical protein